MYIRKILLESVKTKEMEQAMKADAEGWIQQINQNRRVSVYGINFDTAKATIRPDSGQVLNERRFSWGALRVTEVTAFHTGTSYS